MEKHFSVLGYATTPTSSGSIGVAIQPTSENRTPVIYPKALLGHRNLARTEAWLLDNDLGGVLDDTKLQGVGTYIRHAAKEKSVLVINTKGGHKFEQYGEKKQVYVWSNKYRSFGASPTNPVLLVEDAAVVLPKQGDLTSWKIDFSAYLKGNPRLLVAVCVALASALTSFFNRNGFVLALVNESSQGKSTILSVCISLIGNKELLKHWNATSIGVQDHVSAYPDQPTFLDDMHKADNPKDALTLVMSIGNGSRRMVSKHTTRGKNEETQTSIKTNLLVSSEDTLQVFARKHGIHIDGGIMARYFEVEKGEYGMFDDLCGHANGDEMSKKLDQLSMAHEGAVWPSWISRLSANWEKVIRWYGRNMSIIRDDIMQSAGDPKFDDVTNRVVDSLTFAAFAGCVASKLGILEVERTTITAAFGLMVKEHVDRQPAPATPSAQICIDALRGYLQANQAKFLSIDDFDSQPQSNEMVVYKHNGRKHGSLFLFPVPTFRNKFVKQYGNEIFEHLRTAGYLASQPGRNNRMTLRIPPQDGKEVEFPSFIAIKKSILDVEADE